MTNPHYNHTSGVPAALTRGSSLSIRTEFDLVGAGFDAVNLFVGYGNSGGGSNTQVGYGLGNNVSGTNNVAIGEFVLSQLVSGQYNVSVGKGTLGGVISTNYNTAIGHGALGGCSGQENTALGAFAGLSLTTGRNNIIIGYNAEPATATTNNSITLGNSSHTVLRCQQTSITALSDARDKTDVADLSFGLDFIASLRPVAFTWNMRDGAKVGIRSSGFIAQELQEAQQNAGAAETLNLVYDENPEKLEATYGHLIPVMVKAIQELGSQIAYLRANR